MKNSYQKVAKYNLINIKLGKLTYYIIVT